MDISTQEHEDGRGGLERGDLVLLLLQWVMAVGVVAAMISSPHVAGLLRGPPAARPWLLLHSRLPDFGDHFSTIIVGIATSDTAASVPQPDLHAPASPTGPMSLAVANSKRMGEQQTLPCREH